MKDYLDCAYFRGYRMGRAVVQAPWTVASMSEDETEDLLVSQIPHIPEMFQKATGHTLSTVTEGDIVTALKWWARGYCKGRMGGSANQLTH